MRSAASLSAISPRAPETTASSAPPSTTIPSGGRPPSCHCGKRCSSGRISALPRGDRPISASSTRLAAASLTPARAKRVAVSATPMRPSVIRMLDGSAKKPRILARAKNIDARSGLLLRLVARLGGVVGRIEAGQRRPLLHLGKRPVLEPLLLGPELRYLLGERDG